MNRTKKYLIIVILCGLFSIGGLVAISSIQENKDYKADTSFNEEIPEVSGKTYYVDAEARLGNDGLTPETALQTLEEVNKIELQPGDQVLFKRGCKWNGTLVISNSGTKEKPISYNAYGKGSWLPVFDAHGMTTATIVGEDVSYIHIQNLEVMNTTKGEMGLRGISITSVYEDVEGIVIRDNYVHDVESAGTGVVTRGGVNVGLGYTDFHWNGGIVVRAGGYKTKDEKDKKVVRDILIEDNLVEKAFVEGIVAGGIRHWKKCENITIRNNEVYECGGEGIAVFTTDSVLIEGNICGNNGKVAETEKTNFVGIMTIYVKDAVIQYNEIYGQTPCVDDGQAIDADDTCDNIMIQYNYSHDNANGFLLLFNYNNNGHSVVRYNVSQNDNGPFVTIACKDSSYPMVATTEIYNNTCYTNKPITEMIEIAPNLDMREAESKRLVAEIENNIFCSVGSKNVPVLNRDTYYAYMEFNNNCWYGVSERTLPKSERNQIVGDPKLTYAGSANKGFDSVFGYKLLKDSPCLNTGKVIYNNGGLDFYGNKIGTTVNVGAYMGDAVKPLKGINIALNQPTTMSSMQAIAMLKKNTLAQLVDGQATVNVSTKLGTENKEEWFEVELNDEYELTKVVLKTGEDPSLFPKDFAIEIWDGSEWKVVVNKTGQKVPEPNDSLEFTFKKTTGTKVRIKVTEMRKNADDKYAAELSEIEVYQ